MDMGIEHENWCLGSRSGHPAGEDSALDWHALRARFAAALATRRALGLAAESDGTGTNDTLPAGSFDRASARLLDAYEQGLSHVNRTDLSNGKSGGGNAGCTDRALQAGGRG